MKFAIFTAAKLKSKMAEDFDVEAMLEAPYRKDVSRYCRYASVRDYYVCILLLV